MHFARGFSRFVPFLESRVRAETSGLSPAESVPESTAVQSVTPPGGLPRKSAPETTPAPAAPTTDPAAALAEAVRALAREAIGAPPPATEAGASRKGHVLELLTLGLLTVDLAGLAVLLQPELQSPFIKLLSTLAPSVFAGAVGAFRNKLPAWLTRHPGVLAVAIVGALPLRLLFPTPLPLQTDGNAVVTLDSQQVMMLGEKNKTLRIRGFRGHTLVVSKPNYPGADLKLNLDRRDQLAGLMLAAKHRVPGNSSPSFAVAPYSRAIIDLPGDSGGVLELTGTFSPLVERELTRQALLREGVVRIALPDGTSPLDTLLPPGQYGTIRLRRGSCLYDSRVQDSTIAFEPPVCFR